jgi:HNH endonuclease
MNDEEKSPDAAFPAKSAHADDSSAKGGPCGFEAALEINVDGHKVLIDRDDAPLIEGKKLRIMRGRGGHPYVRWDVKVNGRKTLLTLHRVVLGLKSKKLVDHLNGNTLDNRKENLRCVCHSVNMKNQKLREGKELPRNIAMDKDSFRVTFKRREGGGRETLYAKSFKTLAEAVIARDNWIRENDWHGLREEARQHVLTHDPVVLALREALKDAEYVLRCGAHTQGEIATRGKITEALAAYELEREGE